MKLIIINGPNLNLLGIREKEIYGETSFEEYLSTLKSKFKDVELEFFQSNHEGELIEKIQEVGFSYEGIIINAGGVIKTWDNKKIFDGGRVIACTSNKIFNECRIILNKKTHLRIKQRWV